MEREPCMTCSAHAVKMVYQPLGWLGWGGGRGGIARFHAVVGGGGCWEILVQVGLVGNPSPPTPFPSLPSLSLPPPDRLPTGCHTIACNKTLCGCMRDVPVQCSRRKRRQDIIKSCRNLLKWRRPLLSSYLSSSPPPSITCCVRYLCSLLLILPSVSRAELACPS